MTIGQKVKQERERHGWSQAHLSDVSGVPQSTISTIESRTKRPDAVTLNDIARALGITVDALLNEEVKN